MSRVIVCMVYLQRSEAVATIPEAPMVTYRPQSVFDWPFRTPLQLVDLARIMSNIHKSYFPGLKLDPWRLGIFKVNSLLKVWQENHGDGEGARWEPLSEQDRRDIYLSEPSELSWKKIRLMVEHGWHEEVQGWHASAGSSSVTHTIPSQEMVYAGALLVLPAPTAYQVVWSCRALQYFTLGERWGPRWSERWWKVVKQEHVRRVAGAMSRELFKIARDVEMVAALPSDHMEEWLRRYPTTVVQRMVHSQDRERDAFVVHVFCATVHEPYTGVVRGDR